MLLIFEEHFALVKLNIQIILCLYFSPSLIQFYHLSGMRALALQAKEAGRSNVAFLAFFVTGQVRNDSHKITTLFLLYIISPHHNFSMYLLILVIKMTC